MRTTNNSLSTVTPSTASPSSSNDSSTSTTSASTSIVTSASSQSVSLPDNNALSLAISQALADSLPALLSSLREHAVQNTSSSSGPLAPPASPAVVPPATVPGQSLPQSVNITDAELQKKRQRALELKQFLLDNKVDIYRENILGPREEMLKAKREAEFYKFNSTWRGRGQRLRSHGADQTEHDFLCQEFLMHGDAGSVEGTDIEQSHANEETIDNNECAYDAECTSRQEQIATESLRHRTNKQRPLLPEQPNVKEKGVITVALRCPDGAVQKRRFTVESQIKVLFTFADWLGYSPSRHVILTTYPRKQLSDVTQTLREAGLTHDTALVLEEI